MLIDKNTVSAKNQVKNSSKVFYLGNPNAKTKILIVGNSITIHGPKEEIGWFGDWGMSASALEKDYVHRLYAMLSENGYDVYLRISQTAEWERNFLKDDVLSNYDEDREFDADVLIFRLGENVLSEDRPHIKEPLNQFVNHICPNGKVIFTTCFWRNAEVDNAITAVAQERGDALVDCCFSKDKKNMALGQFEHYGVSIHPNDEGMEEIARAIFNQLKVSLY